MAPLVRNEDTENGFEIWRRLRNQSSLPGRARSTNLLNEIIGFPLRNDHLESDLSEFIILKNTQEKTTGRLLDTDLANAEDCWSVAVACEVACQEHQHVH